MARTERPPTRERVSAHRERLRAAGRIYVNTDLPGFFLTLCDSAAAF